MTDKSGFEQAETRCRSCCTRFAPARGVTGHNVRYVLGFGLAAVIIAFAIILIFNFFP
jgi:hypothetical protein